MAEIIILIIHDVSFGTYWAGPEILCC